MASMKKRTTTTSTSKKLSSKSSHMEDLKKWSHMEQLANWIVNVRQKKLKCHKTLKRNFRMEAVLTHALHKAEYEFRAKQLSRMSRWRRLQKDLLKNVDYGTCALYNATEREKQDLVPERNTWRELNLCEDLSSLDNFLQQLGAVKPDVRR
ncbi:uncharacterized protein LOC114945908 [Nylanderia fulva]|uniref:uncharacterized protein LOC114945908 n=1 Tax=Nylanderia fulva TaxID=613905 RepID=UPI0010FB6DA3|nr:uncharacterized protein LOC114945908 [Nylanderia fulva]